MQNLVIATNNKHKLEEISDILKNKFKILSLKDINCFDEIPEEQDTIEGNASQKSFYIFNKFKVNCFADDTGLEIEVLDGRPGVYSARYSGENATYDSNIDKVLKELENKTNRNAQFITVISLIIDGIEHQFKGVVKGVILEKRRGTSGFGYDPIFQPEGFDKTFAEMTLDEKNKISHRGLAVQKLVEFLG